MSVDRVRFSRPCMGREEEEAAAAAIRSGWIVGGPRLQEFEGRFAELSGAGHAVGVSSWTTGAFIVLKALGIGPGDEVIVPSLTFIASVNVIVHAGATPVFADIDPDTFNVSPRAIEKLVTPKTRAIMPVDQLGLPCEIDDIKAIADRYQLHLVEDAACAFGSGFKGRPVGAAAPVTVFSLHARKVVTTGEGGMIVTDDPDLVTQLRRLRHQGMSLTDYERSSAAPTTFESYPVIGYNCRITDVQAAIGNCQLDRIAELLARRREAAEFYLQGLSDHPFIVLPHVPSGVAPNWQSFQIRVAQASPRTRNEVMDLLYAQGIETRRGVMASHLEEPYRHFVADLPETEAAAAECLQLPMHAGLSKEDTERVVSALNLIFG